MTTPHIAAVASQGERQPPTVPHNLEGFEMRHLPGTDQDWGSKLIEVWVTGALILNYI